MVRVWEQTDTNDAGSLTAGERRINRQERSRNQEHESQPTPKRLTAEELMGQACGATPAFRV